MIEKPDKSAKEERRERMKRRSLYIGEQAPIAIFRDEGYCIFCYFVEGKLVPYEEVHHFYGRGREEGDWREHYSSLGCVCKKHHPRPIHVEGKHPEIEKVLRMANKNPINSRFVRPESEE